MSTTPTPTTPNTIPNPALLALAEADVDAFRQSTMNACIEAGYRGAAEQLERGAWPTAWWASLSSWATRTVPTSKPAMADAIRKAAEAREHLIVLAAAHGLRFHHDAPNEKTVMVGADGMVVGDDDIGWHDGEPIKDPMGDDPVAFFEAMSKREEGVVTRAKENGETIRPRIYTRRAAWYKMAAELVKRDREEGGAGTI